MKIYKAISGGNTVLVSRDYIPSFITLNKDCMNHFLDDYNQLMMEVMNGEITRCYDPELEKFVLKSLLQYKLGKQMAELNLYRVSIELRNTETFLIAAPNEATAKKEFKQYCPFEPFNFELVA